MRLIQNVPGYMRRGVILEHLLREEHGVARHELEGAVQVKGCAAEVAAKLVYMEQKNRKWAF